MLNEPAPVPETGGASPQAIQHHYDVGTDFYRLWLDDSLTYSAARWNGPDSTLESAQRDKIDFHLRAVGAGLNTRLLDIGCGWGATLLRAVDEYGARGCTGLTLSRAQHDHIRSLARPEVEVLLESYEDHRPKGLYDGIVSVGAFEHFARPGMREDAKIAIYRRFFQRCRDWLAPQGRLSLQSICWGDASAELRDRILPQDVFPESDLPVITEIFAAASGIFQVVALENRRADYVATLEEWLRRLRARKDQVLDMRDGERLFDFYERYLRQSAIGFRKNRIHLLRIVFEPAGR
ncbi:MAG: class I SAM-dependent methyltransferase [Alphaproteobacteria bacterium]|nr:class I SAM-dependent methyltransferase [Alphaproteobacteria bacterium]